MKKVQSKPPFSQLSYTQSSAEADIFLPLIWFQTSILYHSSCNTSPDKSEQFSPGVEMREEFRLCFVFFTVSGDTYLIYPEYRMQVGTVHPKLKSHNIHNTMSFQNAYKCFLFLFLFVEHNSTIFEQSIFMQGHFIVTTISVLMLFLFFWGSFLTQSYCICIQKTNI